jgi:exopolysaccharide production protein ExoQ
MAPGSALTLCFAFVLFAFVVDFRQRRGTSAGLWIPVIWMMIVSSRMVSLWFDHGATTGSIEAYSEGSSVDRNIFAVLIFLGALVLLRRKLKWAQICKSNLLVIGFVVYCLASLLWSEFPLVSFKRWTKEIGNLVMVLIVLSDRNPVEAMSAVFRRCSYVLIPLSITLYKYYPEVGRQYHEITGELMIVGVATGKNGLGALCLICGLFFTWYFLVSNRLEHTTLSKWEILINVAISIMIVWLIISANSGTSLACFGVGSAIIVLIGARGAKGDVPNVGGYLLGAILLYSVAELSFGVTEKLVLALGRDPTLTGRTFVWKDLLDMVESPMRGTGYGSFWLGDRMKRLWEVFWWHPTEAHNGYLETYLELGLIGLCLLIGMVASGFVKAKKMLSRHFGSGLLRISFVIITLLYNMTESAFKGTHPIWFVLLLSVVTLGGPEEAEKSSLG